MTKKKKHSFHPERLRELAEEESDYIRQMVAADLETPEDVLIKLSRDNSSQVALVLLTNENTPIEAYRNLLASPSDYVKNRTANHVISLYANAKLNLTDQELCDVVQLANVYKRIDNFRIIELIEQLQNEREHKLWLFCGNSSKQKPQKS